MTVHDDVETIATVVVEKQTVDVDRVDEVDIINGIFHSSSIFNESKMTQTTGAEESGSTRTKNDKVHGIAKPSRRPLRVSCKAVVEQSLLEDMEHVKYFEEKYGKVTKESDGLLDRQELLVSRQCLSKSMPRKISLVELLKP